MGPFDRTPVFWTLRKRSLAAAVNDYYAMKYINKLVYVWKGQFKRKVGRVNSIDGQFARLTFTGTVEGRGVQTVKREYLIR